MPSEAKEMFFSNTALNLLGEKLNRDSRIYKVHSIKCSISNYLWRHQQHVLFIFFMSLIFLRSFRIYSLKCIIQFTLFQSEEKEIPLRVFLFAQWPNGCCGQLEFTLILKASGRPPSFHGGKKQQHVHRNFSKSSAHISALSVQIVRSKQTLIYQNIATNGPPMWLSWPSLEVKCVEWLHFYFYNKLGKLLPRGDKWILLKSYF